MSTPPPFLEAFRVGIAKRLRGLTAARDADKLTLAEEESFDAWVRLSKWSCESPITQLPSDLEPQAWEIAEAWYFSHDRTLPLLLALATVDAATAKQAACHCVIAAARMARTHTPLLEVERKCMDCITGLADMMLSHFRGDGSAPARLWYEANRTRHQHHFDAGLRGLLNAMEVGSGPELDAALRMVASGTSSYQHPSGKGATKRMLEQENQICILVMRAIPCPPASEWVRVEVAKTDVRGMQ